MDQDDSIDDGRPAFDTHAAALLLRKYVIVGITYCDSDGHAIQQRQVHGRIDSVHPTHGISIELRGHSLGEYLDLPPDTRPFERAKPGRYTLRSTGEVVRDPDFTCSWTITKPL